MKLQSDIGDIEIVDELGFSFGSTDTPRSYPFERDLSEEAEPLWIHGVIVDGSPVAVFGSDGGGTRVHEHSAILVGRKLYLAIGNKIVCMDLTPFHFHWSVQVDTATCFGVYYEPHHAALLSHGEVEIARISEAGEIAWNASGADIFTNGFELRPECIEVIDCNDKVYRFEYESGRELA